MTFRLSLYFHARKSTQTKLSLEPVHNEVSAMQAWTNVCQ
jgi:hypothetical protein